MQQNQIEWNRQGILQQNNCCLQKKYCIQYDFNYKNLVGKHLLSICIEWHLEVSLKKTNKCKMYEMYKSEDTSNIKDVVIYKRIQNCLASSKIVPAIVSMLLARCIHFPARWKQSILCIISTFYHAHRQIHIIKIQTLTYI